MSIPTINTMKQSLASLRSELGEEDPRVGDLEAVRQRFLEIAKDRQGEVPKYLCKKIIELMGAG